MSAHALHSWPIWSSFLLRYTRRLARYQLTVEVGSAGLLPQARRARALLGEEAICSTSVPEARHQSGTGVLAPTSPFIRGTAAVTSAVPTAASAPEQRAGTRMSRG